MNANRQQGTAASRLFYGIQFFYGSWFVFHGLNWWLRYFPEKTYAPDAKGLIPELIHSGLFDAVKLLEIVIGAALMANVFVPLAIVAAFPIAIVIAWVNFTKFSIWGYSVAAVVMGLLGLMALSRLDYYRPMLGMYSAAPGLGRPEGRSPELLPLGKHIIGVVAAFALAAAITYASVYTAQAKAWRSIGQQ